MILVGIFEIRKVLRWDPQLCCDAVILHHSSIRLYIKLPSSDGKASTYVFPSRPFPLSYNPTRQLSLKNSLNAYHAICYITLNILFSWLPSAFFPNIKCSDGWFRKKIFLIFSSFFYFLWVNDQFGLSKYEAQSFTL